MIQWGGLPTSSCELLQILDAVARMASLGFEKSYRETVVLMTRSYLSKLSSVGSAESKTLAPEATTERVEVCSNIYNIMICYFIRCRAILIMNGDSLVQPHSRLFLQGFFLLLANLQMLSCGQIIDTACCLCAQMWGWLQNPKVEGALHSLIYGSLQFLVVICLEIYAPFFRHHCIC